MKMPTDQEWYAKKAAEEADADPTTGKPKLAILNISPEEMTKLEKLANPSRDRIRAGAFEEAARICDEFAAADTHLRDLARADKYGTGVFVHAAEAATSKAIAAKIRGLKNTPPETNVTGDQHTDDIAVDRFAAAMKAKLAKKRAEGRGGWDNPDECSIAFLSSLLRTHIAKGDPVDVGNFAMMIHQREGMIE